MTTTTQAMAWLALLHARLTSPEESFATLFARFPEADRTPARHFAEHLFGIVEQTPQGADLLQAFCADAVEHYRIAGEPDLVLLECIARAFWAHAKGAGAEIAVDLARQTLPLPLQPTDGEFGQMVLHNEEECIEAAHRQAAQQERLEEYIRRTMPRETPTCDR